jgi:hypothetical protein
MPSRGRSQISMPRGARVIAAQAQDGIPVIWAIVDTEAPRELVSVLVLMTGEDFNAGEIINHQFAGTFQLEDGRYVGHVFVWL